MPCYIISYDLSQGRDYAQFHEKIQEFGTWARLTESTWAIVTEKNSVEVRDYLGAYMEKGDRLFVIRSGKEAAWRNVKCSGEWLKKHL